METVKWWVHCVFFFFSVCLEFFIIKCLLKSQQCSRMYGLEHIGSKIHCNEAICDMKDGLSKACVYLPFDMLEEFFQESPSKLI